MCSLGSGEETHKSSLRTKKATGDGQLNPELWLHYSGFWPLSEKTGHQHGPSLLAPFYTNDIPWQGVDWCHFSELPSRKMLLEFEDVTSG